MTARIRGRDARPGPLQAPAAAGVAASVRVPATCIFGSGATFGDDRTRRPTRDPPLSEPRPAGPVRPVPRCHVLHTSVPSPWMSTPMERTGHAPHPARPAPHTAVPPRRVVRPPYVRRAARPAGRHGAQHAGAGHRRRLRGVARPLEPARPHAEGTGRHGLRRRDRLLLVRGLRLLGDHCARNRPRQDARRPALAGQRRLHRRRAAGHGLLRGGHRDAACRDRRDGRRTAASPRRRAAGRAHDDGGRGERPLAVQQCAGADQPGLQRPVRDPGAAGPAAS